jgi:mRNA interferase MazF
MKNSIVLVPFPFDDFSSTKVRPALCLTNLISGYNHVVISFITSQV